MPEILFWQQLHSRVQELAQDIDGVVGVAVRDLKSGRQILLNEGAEFSTGSTIKITVLAALFAAEEAGKIDLSKGVEVRREDTVGGSGVLQHFRDVAVISGYDLAQMMIALSDNTATNMCIDMVGMEEVNALLSAHGFVKTRLRRKMIDWDAAGAGRENTSTPLELVRFLTMLSNGDMASPSVSAKTIEVLKVPKGGPLRTALGSEGVEIANKPGGLDGVTVDAGIIYVPNRPFAMSVMANYTLATRAAEQVGEIFRLVYDYEQVLSRSTKAGRRLPREFLRPES